MKIKSKLLKGIIAVILLGIISFASFYASVYLGFWGNLPKEKDLKNIQQAEASEILDKDGALVGKLFILNRQDIGFEELPEHLIQALIATEDARFYEHNGVDKQSLIRVLFKTILAGDQSAGGGSTISQQLAKNLFGRTKHGIFTIPVVKIKEHILAKRLEEIYSKNEILSLYLNTVPFSGNVYGIEAAAQKFYSKKTNELSIDEAAVLIGTLKANHSYNPKLFPERSQLRRDVVLNQMLKEGYLSPEKTAELMQLPIELKLQNYQSSDALAAYFRRQVEKKAKKLIADLKNEDGESYNLKTDALKIYTTLDVTLQREAEASYYQHLKQLQHQFETAFGNNPPWKNQQLLLKYAQKTDYYKRLKNKKINEEQLLDSLLLVENRSLYDWDKAIQKKVSVLDSIAHDLKFLSAAQLNIDARSGAVRSYIGGINYERFPFDIIAKSKRQVGSTFKPIVYANAIKQGWNPCDYISNKPITYTDQEDWKPKNSGKEEEDPYTNFTLETGLKKSMNIISVRLLEEIGINSTIELSKEMGINSELPKVPSLALGVGEVSMSELAKVYSSFLNKTPVEPHFISKIEDKNGTILYEYKPNETQQEEIFSEQERSIVLKMLQNVVNEGTATSIRTRFGLQDDIAGKTGTTQNNKDGWFVGLTPEIISINWVGHHNHQIGFPNTNIGQGANSALPLFGYTWQKVNQNPKLQEYAKARFNTVSPEISAMFDCEETKRDGFFKRLFSKDEEKKEFENKEKNEEEEEQKKGIFSIFKKKKK